MYLIDSNVYIRAFTEAGFGQELREFHRANLPRLALSAVVASELLAGAETPAGEKALRRGLLEPFRTRRRLHTPLWSTWEMATAIDRRMRRSPAMHPRLRQRSFFHDILIAASARELGATVLTLDTADFGLIARYVDVLCVGPWPVHE